MFSYRRIIMTNWDSIYIYKDGQLFNHPNRKGHRIKHETPVGSVGSSGYLQCKYQYKMYLVHRIIYEIHHGPIPDEMFIDHIDCNELNNRIENLRLASNRQNQQNSRLYFDKKSGLPKGISFNMSGNYQCRIKINGKSKYLGSYKTLDTAESAIREAREKYHGKFARHE